MGVKNSKEPPSPNAIFGMQMINNREVAGVGLVCVQTDKGLQVKEVVEGTAAQKCGMIHAGDMLKQVDGVAVEKWSLKDVSNLVLGQVGEEVCLKFKRKTKGNTQKYIVKLTRSVKASLEPRMIKATEDGCNVVRHVHLDTWDDPSTPPANRSLNISSVDSSDPCTPASTGTTSPVNDVGASLYSSCTEYTISGVEECLTRDSSVASSLSLSRTPSTFSRSASATPEG